MERTRVTASVHDDKPLDRLRRVQPEIGEAMAEQALAVIDCAEAPPAQGG